MQTEQSEAKQQEELGRQAQRSQQQEQQGPQRPYSSKHELNAYGGLISLLPDILVPP